MHTIFDSYDTIRDYIFDERNMGIENVVLLLKILRSIVYAS